MPVDVDENLDEEDSVNEEEEDPETVDEEEEGKEDGEDSVNEEEDPETVVDADTLQMKTLRCTTSAHDDWLHRGPYLHDMAFHTYVEYCDRVRLPGKTTMDEQIFFFEPHYALAKTYGQRIKTPARIPVLEALKFVPPGDTTKEDNALYRAALIRYFSNICSIGHAVLSSLPGIAGD